MQLAGVKDQINGQFQTKGLFGGDPGADPAYSETFYPFSSFGWNPSRSGERPLSYIEAPQPECTTWTLIPEKPQPGAQQPQPSPFLKENLEKRLTAILQRATPRRQPDPDAQES